MHMASSAHHLRSLESSAPLLASRRLAGDQASPAKQASPSTGADLLIRRAGIAFGPPASAAIGFRAPLWTWRLLQVGGRARKLGPRRLQPIARVPPLQPTPAAAPHPASLVDSKRPPAAMMLTPPKQPQRTPRPCASLRGPPLLQPQPHASCLKRAPPRTPTPWTLGARRSAPPNRRPTTRTP